MFIDKSLNEFGCRGIHLSARFGDGVGGGAAPLKRVEGRGIAAGAPVWGDMSAKDLVAKVNNRRVLVVGRGCGIRFQIR